jgi:hypothetical protein
VFVLSAHVIVSSTQYRFAFSRVLASPALRTVLQSRGVQPAVAGAVGAARALLSGSVRESLTSSATADVQADVARRCGPTDTARRFRSAHVGGYGMHSGLTLRSTGRAGTRLDLRRAPRRRAGYLQR